MYNSSVTEQKYRKITNEKYLYIIWIYIWISPVSHQILTLQVSLH